MSTLIRAGEAGQLLQRLSTVDLADHLREAHTFMDESKRRAQQIVAQAEARAAEVLKEANRVGHAAGFSEGRDEGFKAGRQAAFDEAMQRFEKEQSDVVESMKRSISDVDGLKRDLLIAAERDLLEFAVAVASKLTFSVGRLHRESAVENLKRALRQVAAKTNLTIYAHTNDIESLKKFASSVIPFVEGAQAFRIEADPALAPGGCRVENDRTKIDATLETQVDELVSVLLGENLKDA